MAETMNDNLAGAFTRLTSAIEGFQIQLVSGSSPALKGLVDGLAGAINVVTDLMERFPLLTTAVLALSAAFIALVALAPFIAAFISVIGSIKAAMAGLALTGFAATVAGWAGAIVPFIAALKGIIATAAAVAAGFVGWPLIIGAAVVAAAVVVWRFRDQIGAFFQWVAQSAIAGWNALIAPLRPALDAIGQAFAGLVGVLSGFWTGAAKVFYQLFIEPIVKSSQALWDLLTRGWNAVSGVASGIFRAIANAYQGIVVKPLVSAWTRIVDTAKAALRGLLGWAARAMNGVIDMVNAIIRGINRVRSMAGLSTFGQIGQVQVPAFAEGGYVTKPTLGLLREKGENEYIVPESKMAAASSRFLGGARGASVIPSSSSSGAANGISPIQIAITTGPVMQDQSGQRWMTIEDGERLARQTAEQVQRQLRTPGGRYAAGVR